VVRVVTVDARATFKDAGRNDTSRSLEWGDGKPALAHEHKHGKQAFHARLQESLALLCDRYITDKDGGCGTNIPSRFLVFP